MYTIRFAFLIMCRCLQYDAFQRTQELFGAVFLIMLHHEISFKPTQVFLSPLNEEKTPNYNLRKSDYKSVKIQNLDSLERRLKSMNTRLINKYIYVDMVQKSFTLLVHCLLFELSVKQKNTIEIIFFNHGFNKFELDEGNEHALI